VRDRCGMDYDAGTGLFRAVLDSGLNAGAALQIWSSPGPLEATPVSRLAVPVRETLTAARFDGTRVYLVTAMRIDPLWVVDAGDPAHPVIAGELTMPGQLDFLEPMEGHNTAEFTLSPTAGGTQVRWAMFGPAPYVSKLIGIFVSMDRMIGGDFEAGLAKLKAAAEK